MNELNWTSRAVEQWRRVEFVLESTVERTDPYLQGGVGERREIGAGIRATEGRWDVPEKPDGGDWVLVVEAERG